MEAKKTVYVIQWRTNPNDRFSSHVFSGPPRRYVSLELAQTQLDEFIKADTLYPHLRTFTYEYHIKAMTIKASSKVHVTSLKDIAFTVIPK